MTVRRIKLVAETPRGMVLGTLIETSGPWLHMDMASPLRVGELVDLAVLGPGPDIILSARVRDLGPPGPSRLLVCRSCAVARRLLWPDGGLDELELSVDESDGAVPSRAARTETLLEALRRGLKGRRGR